MSGKTKNPRSIATRTGDDGTTDLLFGKRVPKNDPRLEAVGALDELNAALGGAKATTARDEVRAQLTRIQEDLIAFMGELSCDEADRPRYRDRFPSLTEDSLRRVDTEIAQLEAGGLSFEGWALPGANPAAAALDFARSTARRAERRLLDLSSRHNIAVPDLHRRYINRVSDLLWLLARHAEGE